MNKQGKIILLKTNIDKRFGDAVGYLNSDNDGIAIGGAYALFQIAKEDERYKSIVANIFCDFISANFSSGNKIRLIGVVKELLFQNLDTVFLETELTLRNISFEKMIDSTVRLISGLRLFL